MNPKTKDRVKYARKTQLGLRITTLLAALCSLFCSVVIKGASVTVIWIIRAGVSTEFHAVNIHFADRSSLLSQSCTLSMEYAIMAALQSPGRQPRRPAMAYLPRHSMWG